MSKYKIGVIGLRMGGKWVQGVDTIPDAELTVVYDKNMELTRKIAEQYNTTGVGCEEEFFASDMDVAIIATPDHLHVPQCIEALSKGMHVICEKPLAGTVKECEQIIEAVKKYKKFFMVGQVCRYAPAFRLAKELIDNGEIGEIAFIESEYAHDYLHAPGVDNWRKDPKIKREGFIGGGCHALDLIRWIAGEPTEVHCYANRKFLPDWPTNDTGVAIFKLPNEVIGKVFVSTGIRSKYTMRTVVYGTKGTIICDNTSTHIQLYKSSYRGASKSPDFWEIPVKVDNHNVTSEVEEFINYLKKNEQCPTDVYEGTRTVAFGEAALISVREGRPVKMEEVF